MVTPNPSHTLPASWGLALAATSVLLIGGGAVIWAHRGPPEPVVDEPAIAVAPGQLPRWVPMPIDDAVSAPDAPDPAAVSKLGRRIHSVTYAVENGTTVIKIRVVPGGDELIVDAATGRLIETRPSTSPAPVGPRVSAA